MSENKELKPANTSITPEAENIKKKRDIKTIVSIVVAAQIVLAILLGIFLFKRSYTNGKNNTSEKIRKDAYESVYGATEQANHVSNRVTITLEGIREKADLEVLEVNSSYLYVSDEEDLQSKQTIWYSIPGRGSFTIDMRMAEYIVDNDRHQIHVIAPSPSITKFEERSEDIKPLFYKDERFTLWEGDGSVREGEQIAQRMMIKARTQMLKDLNMNRSYFQAAEDSATRLITSFIKALNPSIPDMKVTVEFKSSSAS